MLALLSGKKSGTSASQGLGGREEAAAASTEGAAIQKHGYPHPSMTIQSRNMAF
jgi:hypothetical protein